MKTYCYIYLGDYENLYEPKQQNINCKVFIKTRREDIENETVLVSLTSKKGYKSIQTAYNAAFKHPFDGLDTYTVKRRVYLVQMKYDLKFYYVVNIVLQHDRTIT